MGTGVLLRGAMISVIYNKALTLFTRARHVHPNGKLVDHISTDAPRIDFAAQFFHMGWTAPIQLIICLIILLVNLGQSALAGFAVFVVIIPLQTRAMCRLLSFCQNSSPGRTLILVKSTKFEIQRHRGYSSIRARSYTYSRLLQIHPHHCHPPSGHRSHRNFTPQLGRGPRLHPLWNKTFARPSGYLHFLDFVRHASYASHALP